MENLIKRYIPFVILFIVVVLYVKPFFSSGYFTTHDGEWAIVRMSEMQRELRDLQIPPRWSDYLNHGYGYPLFSYTYPGPFYAGIVLRLFKIGLTDSVKIIFIGSVAISAVSMFLLGRTLAGNYAGLIASLFYVIAPFRLVDLYVRGSIGESVSLAMFPLLFYASIRYILRPGGVKMVFCSVILAYMILSHNVMSLVFFPFFLVFLYVVIITYFEDVKLYTFRYFLPMILLGLGISAFFFFPAMIERNYVILSKIKLAEVSDNFIRLPEYLFSKWSYQDKPSFQLGWAHIAAVILSIISFVFGRDIDKKKYLTIVVYLVLSIIVLIFFAHPISWLFWQLPFLSNIDFPWRLLTPLAFFIALSSIFLSLHKSTRIIAGILIGLTVILGLGFAKPNEYIQKPDDYYNTNDATTTSKDELMPIWATDKPTERYEKKVELENIKGLVYDLQHNSKKIIFRVKSDIPTIVKVNTLYFPGWTFFVRGIEVHLDYQRPDGLIRFEIPAGDMQIEGYFRETTVRLISNIVSLISILISIGIVIYSFASSIRLRLIKSSKK